MNQLSLFAPTPCPCGAVHEPHYLPNYEPPVWVMGRPPRCGENLYAPTREALVCLWEGYLAGRVAA